MSTNKIPLYRIYFYLILLFGSTVLASNLSISSLQFDGEDFETAESKEFGYKIVKEQKSKKSFFFPPGYIDNKTEHVAWTQTCFQADDSTQFFAVTDEDDFIRYSWNFGTGNIADTSDQKNPFFFYQTAGEYPVKATFFKSKTDFITIDTIITIDNDFLLPDLGIDTAVCPKDYLYVLDPYPGGEGPTGATYRWSNGKTSDTIHVDSAGNYWVEVTVGSCKRLSTVEVTTYGVERKRAANWYFGQNGGIKFDPGPTAKNDAQLLNAPEGTSVISDINGKILFYTDGYTIYNRDHEKLKKGDTIGGTPNSTQSSIIIPWPNRIPYYFVFTTNSNDKKLAVSLVDMAGDEANGEVLYKNNLLDVPVTEKLTSIALQNLTGVDSIYWLVTQEDASGAFKVYKIDSTGINQPPQTFNFGRPITGAATEGQIKVSTTGKYLAVAMGDRVDLYNFNDTTGAITDSVSIKIDGNAPTYGVEFSPDGSKLYVSDAGGIYQIDIEDTTQTRLPNDTIRSPKHITKIATGVDFGALQVAPDNNIYVAIQGSTHLGVIRNSWEDDDEVEFIEQGFDLNGATSTKGLPNFVQSFIEPPQGPSVAAEDACGPGPINLFGSGWGDRDYFEWTIDGQVVANGKMLTQLTHNFALGRHVVSLRVYNDCDSNKTLDPLIIDVVGGPKPINLGGPFNLCPGGSQTLDAGPIEADEEYIWSTGETTQTITVTQPGTYTVAVLKSNGCAEVAQAVVSPPTFGDIQGNTVLCQGEVSRLTTSSPGLAHRWRYKSNPDAPGAPSDYATATYIDVSVGGEYFVELTDANGCKDVDSIIVTVSPRPVVVPNVARKPTCNSNDGRIVLSPGSETNYPNYTYQWFTGNNQPIAGATINTLDNIPAGLYRVVVTHPQGCDETYVIDINPGNVTIDALPAGATICQVNAPETNAVSVTINGYTDPFPVSQNFVLQAYNQATNVAVGNPISFNTSSTTVNLPEGSFYITVTDPNQGNCVYRESNIIIAPSTSKPAIPDLGPPVFTCNDFYPLPTPAAYPSTWVAYNQNFSINYGSVPTPSNALEPTPNKITKTVNYVLTATNGNCVKKDTLTVTYVNFEVALPTDVSQCISQGAYVITPTFTPSIPASVSNNFAYTWTSTDPAFRSTAASIAVLQSGTYTLSVTDNRTGCTATDNQQVTISPTPVDNLGRDITEGCEGDISRLDAGNNGPNTTYLWRGPGVTGSSTQTVNASVEGQYIVDVTLGSCTRSFDILVNRNPPPVSNLPSDTLFCSKRTPSVRLVGGPAVFNQSYSWLDSATGSQVSDVFDVNIIKGGTYYLTIIDSRGCITRDTIRVLEECEGDLFVGDAFTPNGDSKNDVLQFKGEDIGFFDVSIFNRWGQLIYNGTNALQGWDGRTSGGKDAPSGTYVYVVNYKSTKGDTNRMFKKKGSVVLIR